MIRPLTHYVPMLHSGKLLETLGAPLLIWNAPADSALDSTHELTRPRDLRLTESTPQGMPNALVFELVGSTAEKPSLVLGRSSACDIQVLDDSVSRTHLELKRTADGWTAADVGSKNGTWVGTSRIPSLAPAVLADGARLQVGNVELFFMYPKSFETYLSQCVAHPEKS
jgi:hypothetical protein